MLCTASAHRIKTQAHVHTADANRTAGIHISSVAEYSEVQHDEIEHVGVVADALEAELMDAPPAAPFVVPAPDATTAVASGGEPVRGKVWQPVKLVAGCTVMGVFTAGKAAELASKGAWASCTHCFCRPVAAAKVESVCIDKHSDVEAHAVHAVVTEPSTGVGALSSLLLRSMHAIRW